MNNVDEIKSENNYYCVNCDFKCIYSCDWKRHKTTKKHMICNILNIKRTEEIDEETEETEETKETEEIKKTRILEHKKKEQKSQNKIKNSNKPKNENGCIICVCKKKYKSKSGYWKHKQICDKNISSEIDESILNNINASNNDMNLNDFEQNEIDNNKNIIYSPQSQPVFKITTKMFYELLKQNNELQKSIIELVSEKKSNNSGTTITNENCGNNNKTFNLQIFLNETCKDALNISDFVNQIQLTISDLEETGKLGYAEGISRVFLKNLNCINSTQRPIHCSDSKRETLYIKDEDEWHKEDEDKPILTKAIKQLANKNIKNITEWQKLHPEYIDPTSKINDKYMQIVLNSMSGSTLEESNKNYEKIIKNVVKETVIKKC